MPLFITPRKPLPTPNASFSHHEAFARRLVEDTPSPSHISHVSTAGPLTDIYEDHVLRNAHSFAARSTRSFAASDTLHPPSVDPRQHSGPVLGEIDPNNQSMRSDPKSYRPSPTPSLEKRKAEQILKDHGSPPGLRVTAGGRIVPSDQSPLCSPRFGYSAIQKNGGLIRFAPNYPPSSGGMLPTLQESTKNLPNGFVAQDPTGRLLQVVDGQFLVVNEVNGLPQLYIAAPNLNNFPPGKMRENPMRQQTGQSRGTSSTTGTRMRQPVLSISTQIQALDKQYAKLEQESRDLDKLEVLQRSTMSSKAYQQLIQTRRELVTRLNDIRISLKALRQQQKNSPEQSSPQTDERESPQQQHMLFTGLPVLPHGQMPQGPTMGWSFDGLTQEAPGMIPFVGGPMPMVPDLGYLFPQPGAFPGQMSPYSPLTAAPAGPYPPMFNMMGVPPAEVFHGFANVVDGPQTFPTQIPLVPTASSNQASVMAHGPRRALQDTASSEKESPRRPHALEIKNPEIKSETGQGGKSSLNPMSPSYQPASVGTKPSTPQSNQARARADSPSPALAEAVRAHNAWVGESKAASKSANSKRAFQYESSNASFTTADFFPNNPRDHSINKQAYPASGNRSMNSIKRADGAHFSTPDETPSTPEKECRNPNWNPTIPDTVFDTVMTPPADEETTVAPPGTPEQKNASFRFDLVNNRSQNNMSPKNRRPDLLDSKSTEEVPIVDPEPTLPAVDHDVQHRKSSASSRLPISNSGSAYNEGYRAGEARLPIGPDSSGVWLDGYCAGLRASMKDNIGQGVSSVPHDPSGGKDGASSGTQSLVSKISSPSVHGQGTSRHSPQDTNNSDLSKLKDAVFSSQNENVLLSPESDGPMVSEKTSPKLGGWAKHHGPPSSTESVLTQLRNGEAGFSERTASMVQRQLVGPGITSKDVKAGGGEGKKTAVPESRRNFSVQSQPNAGSSSSYLKAVYPGHRVLSSQLEWKSGSSIAQVAGLAHGYVAQYDGTLNDLAALNDMPPLTRMSGNAGTVNPDTKTTPKKSGPTSPSGYPRFVEGSMKSDERSIGDPTSSSPTRKSPTKAKFAHIAGKAGIKVRVDEQVEQERLSPKEKPRWRDVWRKGH